MADLGGEARTIAFVGAGGAGKTSAIERLAAAYAAPSRRGGRVAARRDGGWASPPELEPLGVSVIAAADAEQAARRLARREAALTLVDTPAAGPADKAAVAQIAADLRRSASTRSTSRCRPRSARRPPTSWPPRSRRSASPTSRSRTPTRPPARALRSSSR